METFFFFVCGQYTPITADVNDPSSLASLDLSTGLRSTVVVKVVKKSNRAVNTIVDSGSIGECVLLWIAVSEGKIYNRKWYIGHHNGN